MDGRRAGLAVVVDERSITCAHVVNTALGRSRKDATEPDGQVALRFPFVEGAEVEAEVSVWGPGRDWAAASDFAVLSPLSPLPEGLAPASFMAIKSGATVRICGPSADHGASLDFVSGTIAGQRRLGIWQLHQRKGPFRAEPGYSGGPVVLHGTNEVVGLTRATRGGDSTEPADVEVLDLAGPLEAMDIALTPFRQREQPKPPDEVLRQPARRSRMWAVLGLVVLLLAATGGLGWQLLSANGSDDASGNVPGPSGSDPASTSLGEPSSSKSSKPVAPPTTTSTKKEAPKDEPPPEPEPVPSQWVLWASSQSGMCIGVENGTQDDEASVVQSGIETQTHCSWEHEKWAFVSGYGSDGSWHKIVNRNSGKCLDTYQGGTNLAAEIVQNTCTDSGGSQLWHVTYDSTNNGWMYYRYIENQKSGYCVDNRSDNTDELALWQAICHESALAQLFRLRGA
ncbi:RICIN domain-containing protein [Phytomonospora endophytica]|uniref:Ricin B lectin domain-containing protein n=1 Tax=Phytomonospora endophytica TaxID=714109 RepID=A0A841FSB6_9ACTN|nr:RICIN domain-containing protein [Phytomonospora endophytica]MBB6037703.1 hypothetical protein [Phytomonospora endophytica]GIG67768.1 hypothetical protein Pen01_40630 [Phytomonospora endophytica]